MLLVFTRKPAVAREDALQLI